MDISKLIDVVKATAAAFVPGAPAMIAAAEAVYELVKEIRPTLGEQDQAKLDAALPALLDKMNVDVDQAIADLGGTGR